MSTITDEPAPISLVKALKLFFEIPASDMVKEFQALTDDDKRDFENMLKDLGYNITRK